MLANSDPNMQEAATTVYRLSKEEKIRQQCEAREDYYRRTVGRERLLKETLVELEKTTAERDRSAAELEKAVAELEKLTSKYRNALEKLAELGINVEENSD